MGLPGAMAGSAAALSAMADGRHADTSPRPPLRADPDDRKYHGWGGVLHNEAQLMPQTQAPSGRANPPINGPAPGHRCPMGYTQAPSPSPSWHLGQVLSVLFGPQRD